MFKGLEKVRSLHQKPVSGGKYLCFKIKIKRNITYFNFRMHRGYTSVVDVVAERLEVVVVVAESLCVEESHFAEAMAQLCLVWPHGHRAHQLKYFY